MIPEGLQVWITPSTALCKGFRVLLGGSHGAPLASSGVSPIQQIALEIVCLLEQVPELLCDGAEHHIQRDPRPGTGTRSGAQRPWRRWRRGRGGALGQGPRGAFGLLLRRRRWAPRWARGLRGPRSFSTGLSSRVRAVGGRHISGSQEKRPQEPRLVGHREAQSGLGLDRDRLDGDLGPEGGCPLAGPLGPRPHLGAGAARVRLF